MKANQAKLKHKGCFVISADTIVYARKTLFFKTSDATLALKNIKLLSGRRHTVYTGITFINLKEEAKFYLSKTKIKFKKLSEKEIKDYLKLDEWKDCSGSYAIQGYGGSFINFISGSYSSAVGMPLEKIYTIFKNYKLL